MRIQFLVLLLLFPGYIFSQDISDTTLTVVPHTFYHLKTDKASGLVIAGKSYNEAIIIAGLDTFSVSADPHSESSVPVNFTQSVNSIVFHSGLMNGKVNIYFLHSGEVEESKRHIQKLSSDSCMVTIIPPSSWRSGLKEPTGTPSKTVTTHIVVHHSAGSNNITDPYQVVRNIYIQHTEINGWSDIGYNYLIAPDGTIFQGRDSKGLFEPDYMVGAHMCGKNQYTMAICMLGTFTSVSPGEEALESLFRLIAWKGEKDDIDLMAGSYHAVGPSSANLPDKYMYHISGHRDGCSPGYTECPGNFLYSMIPAVRQESSNAKENCEPFQEDKKEKLVYPNPTTGRIQANFEWNHAIIYDISGRRAGEAKYGVDGIIDVGDLESGLYILRFITANEKINIKFIKQ